MAGSRENGSQSGFSLIEVLIATTIMAVGLTALAQLCAISTRADMGARTTTFATVLAAQKMEQLRAVMWAFDPLGLPLSDTTTDLTVVPETPTGGGGLAPGGGLGMNVTGYCDFLDGNGRALGGGSTTPPAGTVYVRRWSVEPLPTNPNNTLLLQVLVTRSLNRGTADAALGVRRLPHEARIISVKTRKAS